MRSNTIPGFGLCTALLLVACSQNRDRDHASDTAAEKPAPFDKGPVKIALVQYSGAGDYFEQWTKGAQQQADAVGFTMQLHDARADDARQAADMQAAIASRVSGIILDHGRSATMCPLINQAIGGGIAVVVYDVKVAECAPKAIETAQNDADLAALVLTRMAKDIGDGVPVGYVNPFVIAPLERRDVVWKKFVADHKWDQKFAVGKFSHAVAADNAKLATDALKAHPEVKAVFAPYDELTKGTVSPDPGPPVGRSTRQQAGHAPWCPGYPVLLVAGTDQEHGRLAGQVTRLESRQRRLGRLDPVDHVLT
jgi:simple sugar transport system substrate-binding protein